MMFTLTKLSSLPPEIKHQRTVKKNTFRCSLPKTQVSDPFWEPKEGGNTTKGGRQRGSKVSEEGGCDSLSPSFPQGPTFNATVQLSLETSNQAFEFVTSLLKALENENSNLKLRKYYARKKAHYTGIMLDATTITLYPELCRHNASNLSFKT